MGLFFYSVLLCNTYELRAVYYDIRRRDNVIRTKLGFLIVLLWLLSSCDLSNENLLPATLHQYNQTSLIPKEVPPEYHLPEKKDYFLEIKGKSNQLSPTAWGRMLEWREQIVNFSKGYDHVFVNGPNKKMIALTFDDGPDSTVTTKVIDILDEYDVIGNFFFVGKNVTKYPEVVKLAFEQGHLVLSHSYNHIDLTQIGVEEIRSEIEKTESSIEEIIGKRPAMIRPPYGETDDQVAGIAKERGYSVVLWSIDTLDWSQKEVGNIFKNVIDHVRNGDIILMHTTPETNETQKALPMMIEELQKRNFEIVGLDTMLNMEAYQ